jgi:RNA polymerase sigma-70 factor (ECF subfamily)
VWPLAASNAARGKESGREKIEYIYSEYRHLMLRKAYSILKERALAENALYNAFIHIANNIGRIGDPRSSKSIVFAVTIVRNCSYALMEIDAREYGEAKGEREFNAAGLADALRGMSARDIIKAVNKLGGENKNIFLLYYAYNFSCRKISKALNETETNVAARLQKAQKRLRALLLRGDY